jgi:hypothetical protein
MGRDEWQEALVQIHKIALTAHCTNCNTEVEVERVVREQDKETYYYSCRHSTTTLVKVVDEMIPIKEKAFMKLRLNLQHSLKRVFKIKQAGKSKRPARELLIVEHNFRIKVHLVEEQNMCGEWELVYNKIVKF